MFGITDYLFYICTVIKIKEIMMIQFRNTFEREEILYIRNEEVKEYKDGKTLRRERRKAKRNKTK